MIRLVRVCAPARPDGDSNEVFVTAIVCCVFSWSSRQMPRGFPPALSNKSRFSYGIKHQTRAYKSPGVQVTAYTVCFVVVRPSAYIYRHLISIRQVPPSSVSTSSVLHLFCRYSPLGPSCHAILFLGCYYFCFVNGVTVKRCWSCTIFCYFSGS